MLTLPLNAAASGAFSVCPLAALLLTDFNTGSFIAEPIVNCGLPLLGDVFGGYIATEAPAISLNFVSPSFTLLADIS